MEGWMIAVIVVAGVIAILAIAFIVGALLSAHIVLGRRKATELNSGEGPDIYGVDVSWFDTVKDRTGSVTLTAFDGVKLEALLLKHEQPAERVAVCCHGYGASPVAMQVQAKFFFERGFDVLLPYMRGHGNSGGKIGMAWLDRFDILRWLNKVIELYGKKVSVALFGTSMGGSAVVAAAGMEPPAQLKCVIDDCGFASQLDEYKVQVKHIHLPVRLSLLPLSVGVRLVHGYSIYSADIVPFAYKMTAPALFIHGEADKFVPVEQGRTLFNSCGSRVKKLYTVPGASHARAYAQDPDNYIKTLTEFVGGAMGELEYVAPETEPAPEPTLSAESEAGAENIAVATEA